MKKMMQGTNLQLKKVEGRHQLNFLFGNQRIELSEVKQLREKCLLMRAYHQETSKVENERDNEQFVQDNKKEEELLSNFQEVIDTALKL